MNLCRQCIKRSQCKHSTNIVGETTICAEYAEDTMLAFINNVNDNCNKYGKCCKCPYFDDNYLECAFSDDPTNWDAKTIISMYKAAKNKEAIK